MNLKEFVSTLSDSVVANTSSGISLCLNREKTSPRISDFSTKKTDYTSRQGQLQDCV